MAADLPRLLRHLFARSAGRMYPSEALARIAEAIAAGEAQHRGEICFAVESALAPRAIWTGVDARTRALEVFGQLRVWDTAVNNGVLLYLLLADHRIEIVADRGLDGRVSAEQWRGACQLMEERLKAGEAVAAVIEGVVAVSELLAAHYPHMPDDGDRNELADLPHVL